MAEVTGFNMTYGRELKAAGKTNDKAKNRKMKNVVINKNGNRYMAKGNDAERGEAMAVIMGEETALGAIKTGHAKKGDGWD